MKPPLAPSRRDRPYPPPQPQHPQSAASPGAAAGNADEASCQHAGDAASAHAEPGRGRSPQCPAGQDLAGGNPPDPDHRRRRRLRPKQMALGGTITQLQGVVAAKQREISALVQEGRRISARATVVQILMQTAEALLHLGALIAAKSGGLRLPVVAAAPYQQLTEGVANLQRELERRRWPGHRAAAGSFEPLPALCWSPEAAAAAAMHTGGVTSAMLRRQLRRFKRLSSPLVRCVCVRSRAPCFGMRRKRVVGKETAQRANRSTHTHPRTHNPCTLHRQQSAQPRLGQGARRAAVPRAAGAPAHRAG